MRQRLSSRRLCTFFAGFVALWIAAWLVAPALGWSRATAYWAVAKVLVWVLYPLLYWRAPLPEQLAFAGVLAVNVLSPYPLTIFVLSLVLGYVRVRSGSLPGSVLVHAGNNALSAVLR